LTIRILITGRPPRDQNTHIQSLQRVVALKTLCYSWPLLQ
jgi:hypothetical protein